MKDKKDLYNEIDDNLEIEDIKAKDSTELDNSSDYSLYVIPYKINEFELIKNIHEKITYLDYLTNIKTNIFIKNKKFI